MRNPILSFALVGAVILTHQSVFADHNSPFGEGWARMPNDIHNTRIDTLGDNTTFRDFVRYGNGSDSVNRYLADSDYSSGSRRGMQGLNDYGRTSSNYSSGSRRGMQGLSDNGRTSMQGRGGGRGQGRGRGR